MSVHLIVSLVEAFHVISVICWMAGMLYLPRLYAYHADSVVGSEMDQMFRVMEVRLLRFIMNPAMVLTICFGLVLAYMEGAFAEHWFHGKMLLVVGMVVLHSMFASYRKDFINGVNTKSSKFYRVINEGSTVLMMLIVITVCLRHYIG